VRTLSGTATDGSIRTTWNGRNSKNVQVAAGSYTWKLTATGLDTVGKATRSGTLTAN
jgi:flagellar hook assembly protein FlgD